MTERSPTIAFGLHASAVALKAKMGRVLVRDRLELLAVTLEWVPEDELAREAVLSFNKIVQTDQVIAGAALQVFLEVWLPEVEPRRAEEVLVEIEAEGHQYEWQRRADLQ